MSQVYLFRSKVTLLILQKIITSNLRIIPAPSFCTLYIFAETILLHIAEFYVFDRLFFATDIRICMMRDIWIVDNILKGRMCKVSDALTSRI